MSLDKHLYEPKMHIQIEDESNETCYPMAPAVLLYWCIYFVKLLLLIYR